LKKKQRLDDGGEDGEILEYTKAKWSVKLPNSTVTMPRQHPPPKQKPLTKWEKFRLEKGFTEKQKRSRMVFDEITNDWVPRFGAGSIKKI
jgi:regulator of ribosome biosynthesis